MTWKKPRCSKFNPKGNRAKTRISTFDCYECSDSLPNPSSSRACRDAEQYGEESDTRKADRYFRRVAGGGPSSAEAVIFVFTVIRTSWEFTAFVAGPWLAISDRRLEVLKDAALVETVVDSNPGLEDFGAFVDETECT
jgi:hypothetical protein